MQLTGSFLRINRTTAAQTEPFASLKVPENILTRVKAGIGWNLLKFWNFATPYIPPALREQNVVHFGADKAKSCSQALCECQPSSCLRYRGAFSHAYAVSGYSDLAALPGPPKPLPGPVRGR
ncbi:hypothetical protein Bbelb_325700 [Branchiostoma belcheri]|nr:hypothetical protein Bbelb_325700 [Branchiostoma belcheri]